MVEEKKNTNGILIFVIVGVVVVILLLAFFLLTKYKKTEPTTKDTANNSIVDENNSNKVEEEITEETKKLMMLFPPIAESYQNKLLTAKDFKLGDLYANTMYVIGEYYNDGIYYLDVEALVGDTCSSGSLKYSSDEWYMCYSKNVADKSSEEIAVDEKTFQKYFGMFYGNNVRYQKVDDFITSQNFINYVYQNGYYFSYIGGGGDVLGDGYSFPSIAFQKLETVGDEKNIYVTYVYSVLSCKDEFCNDATVNLYKDNSKNEKIGEVKYDNNFSLNTVDSTIKDKATKYKHTYKKNADGSYYWYSVEPVK